MTTINNIRGVLSAVKRLKTEVLPSESDLISKAIERQKYLSLNPKAKRDAVINAKKRFEIEAFVYKIMSFFSRK